MHLSDALLSVPVAATGMVFAAGAVSVAIRKMETVDLSRTTEMGVWGAFVFAVQMINVAIPGTGASGHLVGTVLLCFLLGPAMALLTMCAVLMVQALLFGDGGLWALGWNVWNMGVIPVICTVPFLNRSKGKSGRVPGWRPVPAALLSIEFAAVSATLVVLFSGRVQLPPVVFLSVMTGIHLPIAAMEGLMTVWILRAVGRSGMMTVQREVAPLSRKSAIFGVLGLALLLAGGISLVASSRPDGLEWSLLRSADTTATPGEPAASDSRPRAIFPDYEIPGAASPLQSVPGLVGTLAVLLVAVGLGRLVRKSGPKTEGDGHE